MNRRRMLAGLAGAVAACDVAPIASADAPETKKVEAEDRPMVALWRMSDGDRFDSRAPYLRYALWADGQLQYAVDPTKWGHELRRSMISATRVARLKAALVDSGIFDLKGTCYLVPDAPCDCMMVELGDKQQTLYWDEVEAPGYGINIDPKPHHRAFKRCWRAVNHLTLVALPDDGEEVKARVQIPKSWYLKPAVQSE